MIFFLTSSFFPYEEKEEVIDRNTTRGTTWNSFFKPLLTDS
jgi:hypothetical protein